MCVHIDALPGCGAWTACLWEEEKSRLAWKVRKRVEGRPQGGHSNRRASKAGLNAVTRQ